MDQQEAVRDALRALGGRATVEAIGDEAILPVCSVKQRLNERPDWFREMEIAEHGPARVEWTLLETVTQRRGSSA